MLPNILNFKDFQDYLEGFNIKQNCNVCVQTLFDKLNSITIVKTNEFRLRTVYHFQTQQGNYFLKLCKPLRFKNRIRAKLLFWRKWEEWRNLVKLEKLGFNVARPCFCGISKKGPLTYFIVTKGIYGRKPDLANLDDAAAIGAFVGALHNNGIYMADLHLGNMLREPDGAIAFFDVQQLVFMPGMSNYWRLRNMAYLFFIGDYAKKTLEWRKVFLQAYNKATNKNFDLLDLDKSVVAASRRFGKKHDKRAYKSGSRFLRVKSGNLRGFTQRDYAIDWHRILALLSTENSIKENRVFKIDDMVVKRHRLRFLHADRCLMAFKMAFSLNELGVSVPRSLAYLKQGPYSYFIAEYLAGAVTVNAYFGNLRHNAAFKRDMIKKFALWVSDIHDKDIFQRDFKSCNILCQNNAFFMVDLEGVRPRKPSFDDKVYNLAQLNASMSKYISLKDRLRFFLIYAQKQNIALNKRRAVLKKIWDIMLTKNTAYYNLAPEDLWLAD